MRRMMVTMTVAAGLALGLGGCQERGDAGGAGEAQGEGEGAAAEGEGAMAGGAQAEDAGAAGVAGGEAGGEVSRAVAQLSGKSGREVDGTATFTSEDGEVQLVVDITKAPPGTHAIHIHENGDCSADDASSAGGHWNPTDKQHGKWGQNGYHLGDIGNLDVSQDGTARLTFSTDEWALGGGGDDDVVGKAVVIHVDPDNFEPPAGHAGARIACGVIEASSEPEGDGGMMGEDAGAEAAPEAE